MELKSNKLIKKINKIEQKIQKVYGGSPKHSYSS